MTNVPDIRDVQIDETLGALLPRTMKRIWNRPAKTFSGIVVDGSNSSETYLYGAGTQHNPIRAATAHWTTFWVRRSDGAEKQFTIRTSQAEFRTGHDVTVIQGSENGSAIGIFNHSLSHGTPIAETPWLRLRSGLIIVAVLATGLGLLFQWASNQGMPVSSIRYNPVEAAQHADMKIIAFVLFSVNLLFVPMLLATRRYRNLLQDTFKQTKLVSMDVSSRYKHAIRNQAHANREEAEALKQAPQAA